MKISLNRWFSLPRLGPSTFSDLMKAKVKYETKLGFKFTSETDVPRALAVLSAALDQSVEMELECFICGNPLDDRGPTAVICHECENKDDAYEIYTMKFSSMMEDLS